MTIREQINTGIKDAMKAKDPATLRSLRALKAAMMVAETAEGRTGAPLDDSEALKIITKQAKQRRDAYEQFSTNGREDLAKTEKEELEVIEKFLPKQMTEDEIRAEVDKIVSETGASSMKDMGKVMGMASKRLAGKADGKIIAGIVKGILG